MRAWVTVDMVVVVAAWGRGPWSGPRLLCGAIYMAVAGGVIATMQAGGLSSLDALGHPARSPGRSVATPASENSIKQTGAEAAGQEVSACLARPHGPCNWRSLVSLAWVRASTLGLPGSRWR
jgi:hypothetical protein